MLAIAVARRRLSRSLLLSKPILRTCSFSRTFATKLRQHCLKSSSRLPKLSRSITKQISGDATCKMGVFVKMYADRNAIDDFFDQQKLRCSRAKRVIKKFIKHMYEFAASKDCHRFDVHEFYSYTPNFIELFNWDTLLYLLKLRYKVWHS